MKVFTLLGLFAFCALPVLDAQNITPEPSGATATSGEADKWTTKVTFYSPSIVRVTKYPGTQVPETKSFSVIKTPGKVDLKTENKSDAIILSSGKITATLGKDGNVSFTSPDGKKLLAEQYNSHAPCANAVDAGKYKVSQSWRLEPEEVILGLGQRQNKNLNQRGQYVRLWSGNTNITIPYFTSEKGYGLYWDNAGDGRFYDTPDNTAFESEVAQAIDYYFMYDGGKQDGVIAAIRDLTGDATMFPLWTLGHWQCRERYKSSDELCDVLDRYRELEVPLDGIVQDWQYWGCDSNWNAMRFMNPHYINKMGDEKWMRYLPYDEDRNARYDEPRIKSPKEMVDYVHSRNAHLMISIWANFGPWTDQYRELDRIGGLYPFETWPRDRGVRPYDPFNPKARQIYWKYLKHLYDMGIDAWWTDSTEPDHFEKEGDADHLTHEGSWRSVKNAFALMTNKGIYENQRKVKNNTKRSVQMTRCGTFGIQHYGTFSWSGDVTSNWDVMKNQIPSGLNYVICGIPFWNTDIGGFFGWDYDNDPLNPAMQELQVRWMQWGCFMPLMRNHCSSPMVSEIYRFGKPGEWAFDTQKKFIKLRYRLLPYIYSMAGDAAHNAGTMMRPLMMDFPSDRRAITLTDQYMFGPSILVKPVTDPLYTYRDNDKKGYTIYPDVTKGAAPVEVYLPEGAKWYDFWTNEVLDGGRSVLRPTPIDIMPLYIKAGSILAFGPDVQYTSETPWNDLEVRIYPGADGSWTLYEDEGDNYNYEKGMYTNIPFEWNDAERTLTIGDRKGSYKGMLADRNFRIVLVDGKTAGADTAASTTRSVAYNGTATSIKL